MFAKDIQEQLNSTVNVDRCLRIWDWKLVEGKWYRAVEIKANKGFR